MRQLNQHSNVLHWRLLDLEIKKLPSEMISTHCVLAFYEGIWSAIVDHVALGGCCARTMKPIRDAENCLHLEIEIAENCLQLEIGVAHKQSENPKMCYYSRQATL